MNILSQEVKDLRRLVIKAFHIKSIEEGLENSVSSDGKMKVCTEVVKIKEEKSAIDKIEISVIKPKEHNRWTNSIMDIVPISTKVLGKLGEGITHTLTGVYVILTGVDVNGIQTAEFGSSEGILADKLYLGRAGTPSPDDYLISFDVTFKAGMGQERCGVTEAHKKCDEFIQKFRDQMKKFKGEECTERHEYHDIVRVEKSVFLL